AALRKSGIRNLEFGMRVTVARMDMPDNPGAKLTIRNRESAVFDATHRFHIPHSTFHCARFAIVAVLLSCPAAASGATWGSLKSLSLPQTTITMAQTVAPGAFIPPAAGRAAGGRAANGGAVATSPFKDLPAFCRVAATLTPTSDSDIRIEVWLPASNWNGKFQAVGNG